MKFFIPQISWPQFKIEQFLIFQAFLLTVLLIWIIYSIVESRKNKVATREALRSKVRHFAKEQELADDERKVLEAMSLAEGELPRLMAFERQIKAQLQKGVSPDLLHRLRSKMRFDRAAVGRHLVSSREFEPGMELSITIEGHATTAAVYTVTEATLTVRVPPDQVARFKRGRPVEVSLWREPDGRYFYEGQVLSATDHPAPVVVLSHAEKLDRVQNRGAQRAEINWTVKAVKMTEEEHKKYSPEQWAEARPGAQLTVKVLDISETGMRLAISPQIAVGDFLVVSLLLANATKRLPAHARVIRKDEETLRCVFVGLTIAESDELNREVIRLRKRVPRKT